MPTIRPRTTDDLPACIAALRAVHDADQYPTNWPADPAGFLTPGDALATWVATTDDGVVGHAVLAGPVEVAGAAAELAAAGGVWPDRLASIARLFVVPAARGDGLARALLDQARETAAAEGRHAALDVVASDPAVGFYERCGWRRVASRPATWTTPAGEHPLMHYYLAPDVTG